MRNSRTTLSELTARYHAVLLKCFMLNAAVLVSISVSSPAIAAVDLNAPAPTAEVVKLSGNHEVKGIVYVPGSGFYGQYDSGRPIWDLNGYTLHVTGAAETYYYNAYNGWNNKDKAPRGNAIYTAKWDNFNGASFTGGGTLKISDTLSETVEFAVSCAVDIDVDNLEIDVSQYGFYTVGGSKANVKANNIKMNTGKTAFFTAGGGQIVVNAQNLNIENSEHAFRATEAKDNVRITIENDAIVRATKNVVEASKDNEVNVSIGGKADLVGDMTVGSSAKASLSISGKESVFTGAVLTQNTGDSTLILNGGSAWNITNDSTVTRLTLNGGKVSGKNNLTITDTLNIANASIVSGGTINLSNATVNATMNGTTPLFTANELVASNTKLNLDVATAGDYTLVSANKGQDGLDNSISLSGTAKNLFTLTTKDGVATVSTQSAEQIAENMDISTGTAEVLASLVAADPTNEAAADISLAAQQVLDSAANGTPAEKAAAQAVVTKELGKLNQESVGARQSVSISTNRKVAAVVDTRVSGHGRSGGDVEPAYGLWIQGMYNKSKLDGAFHGYTRGFALGADVLLDDVWTVGVGYAYNNTDVNLTDRKVTVDGNTIFAYGQYKPSDWFVNGLISYGWNDYEEKATSFTTPIRTKYDSNTYGANLTTGYDLSNGLTPEAGLRYLHIETDDYKNVAGSVISADDDDILTGVVGLRYARTFKCSKGITYKPEVRAAVTYDLISDNGSATVAGNGVNYTVDSKRLPRFGTELGAGVKMTHGNIDLSLNYGVDIRRDYTSHTGTANLKYHF